MLNVQAWENGDGYDIWLSVSMKYEEGKGNWISEALSSGTPYLLPPLYPADACMPIVLRMCSIGLRFWIKNAKKLSQSGSSNRKSSWYGLEHQLHGSLQTC